MTLSTIRSDIARKQNTYVLVNKFFNRVVKVLVQLGTIATIWYRLAYALHQLPSIIRLPLLIPYIPVTAIIEAATGVRIDPGTPIGPGFVIHCFSCIQIQAQSVGKNFTVNQDVYIGYDYTRHGLPTIGDNVFIGCGAKVLGAVNIGDNAVIGANSVIQKNIPEGAVVIGNPGIIVAKNTGDYVNRVSAKKSLDQKG